MIGIVLQEIYGKQFFVDFVQGRISVFEADLMGNLQAEYVGGRWYVRSQINGDYEVPSRENYLLLQQVIHRVPKELKKHRGEICPVCPVRDMLSKRTSYQILWPDGGVSRLVGRTWESRWSDGVWVKVNRNSEHCRICTKVFEESPYGYTSKQLQRAVPYLSVT